MNGGPIMPSEQPLSGTDHATPRDWREVRTDEMNRCFAQNCTRGAEKAATFKTRGINSFVGYCQRHYDEWLENRSVDTESGR